MTLRIGIASDHAGRDLKHLILEFLRSSGNDVTDYGVAVDAGKSVDYPDFAALVARDVSLGKTDLGVLVCGTGIGMSITANKFAGVRAAVVTDEFTARMAKAHNNANVICLGSRVINHHRATDFVRLWLETPFEGARHQMRIDKVRELEKTNFKSR